MGVSEERTERAKSKAEERADIVKRMKAMKNAGYSNESIARAFKITENSVRTFLKAD